MSAERQCRCVDHKGTRMFFTCQPCPLHDGREHADEDDGS